MPGARCLGISTLFATRPRQAEGDVIGIYLYTVETFGITQADAYHGKLEATFNRLGTQPYMARERTEIEPPVRVHPCGSHIIIYTVSGDESILVVRVRHSSEDWISDYREITD